MSDKIRVINPQKFDIGVVTQDKPMGMNIKAGGFVMQTQDDIDYIMSISNLFQRGFLRIEETKAAEIMEAVGIDVNVDENFIDDDDIKKKLSGTPKSIGTWLNGINEPYILDRIYDVAVEMNLNMNKIKVLQTKMPDKNFLGDEK